MGRIGALESSAFTKTHTSTDPADFSRVYERLKILEQESARSRASEGAAVGFHNLGFRSKTEPKAWLQLNAPIDQFGFIVDFHTVMEHVHQQITGVDSLSQPWKALQAAL